MTSPGFNMLVTTQKSCAFPFCPSTLIVKENGFALIATCPPLGLEATGRATRRSPSAPCRMSGSGDAEPCVVLLPDGSVDCATPGGYGPLETSQNIAWPCSS